MAYVLGVDVGTTFTSAATCRRRDGPAEVVALGDRASVIPSVVFLRPDGEWLVGDAARRRAVSEPKRVAGEFKRRIGDPVPVLVGGRPFAPEFLVGVLLAWVAEQVGQREGGPPERLVVTCPANWGEYRRDLLVQAVRQAGLGEIMLLTEPVAAATWYASRERLEPGTLVGIYDLGGGTFDAAVLQKTDTDTGFELVGQPAGDDSLGGVDFDQTIVDYLAEVLGPRLTGLDLADPAIRGGLAQVRAEAVAAKEALSSDLEAEISVILPGATGQVRLTRAEFEERIRASLESTITTFRQAIATAQVAPTDLHRVLLVGGSSRIPLVSELVAHAIGVPVVVDTHPKLAVCLGAAVADAPPFQVEPPDVQPEPPAVALPGAASDWLTVGGTAALTSIIVPFAQALAGKLADDVYAKLRPLFHRRPAEDVEARLRALFYGHPVVERGGVIIRDPDTGTVLVVPSHLPDEAIKQLARKGPKRIRGRILIWDDANQTWEFGGQRGRLRHQP